MATIISVQGGAKIMDFSLADEDEDAEHEEDPMMDEKLFIAGSATAFDLHPPALQEGNADVEQEHAESDQVDDDEVVGPVKMANGHEGSISESPENENLASADEVSDISDRDTSDKASSNGESDVGAEWEEESDGREDEDAAMVDGNACIFCGGDEDNDPSEEYEEYLACSVCGDNSHRQCARNADSLQSDDDSEKWRCPGCIENALEPESSKGTTTRRRSSVNKLTQDLLPAQRGASRPDSHSVFNQLIVNHDPLDGSRLLRKRKASPNDAQESPTMSNKRLRNTVDSSTDSDSSANEPMAIDDQDGGDQIRDTIEVARNSGEAAARPSPRRSRASRPRSLRRPSSPAVRLLKKDPRNLTLSFRVDPSALSNILSTEPKRKKRRPPRPNESQSQPQSTYPYPTPYSSSYATPFYSFHERENDELKSKPYGGILSEADADTSKTLPQVSDRERFNEAKRKAEEAWSKRATSNAEISAGGGTLSQKVAGPASKIQCINFGGYEIDTWYAAPYPEEYSRNRVLYICEFCLKYMNSEYVAWRHKLKCPAKHPPGDEIYRDGSVSVFEVDGRKNPVYCQNLCLLAKLFLGSKTLYYDVEPFLFYVMTEYDELGCRFVGYFSKEKRPSSSNNVSCILTLPIHQRKGYGNLLIDFSYLLTRVENKTGSPEKPLSDMGLVSYRNYWRLVLCYQLVDEKGPLSITDISNNTGMTADDIVSALEGLRALVRDPVTGTYALRLDYDYFREYIEKWEAKRYVRLNPDSLLWTPYIMGRSNLAHLEHAPPLATIAPREGEGDVDIEHGGPEEGIQIEAIKDAGQETGDSLANGLDEMKMDIDPTIAPSETIAGPSPKRPLAKGYNGQDASSVVGRSTRGVAVKSPVPSKGPSIPPTRFEIFPPLPGTVNRRRAGRPVGTLRRRTGTPTSVPRRDTVKSDGVGFDGAFDGGEDHIGRNGDAGKGRTLFKRSTRVNSSNLAEMRTDLDDAEDGRSYSGREMLNGDGHEKSLKPMKEEQLAVDHQLALDNLSHHKREVRG